MIRGHPADKGSGEGIPRESGDDPLSVRPEGLGSTYSPRERG